MKFYLDEDLSPKIAELMRKQGIDCISAHEIKAIQISDLKQLEFALSHCLGSRYDDRFQGHATTDDHHTTAISHRRFYRDRLPTPRIDSFHQQTHSE